MNLDISNHVTKKGETYVRNQITILKDAVDNATKEAKERLQHAKDINQEYQQRIDKIGKEKERIANKIKQFKIDIDNAALEASKECTDECNTGKISCGFVKIKYSLWLVSSSM